ncbi:MULTISPECIES: hypothetical protein [Bacillus]|uniref:hypothetical protein n=1 Tax=Bacillus TaxID=1386 RepID=UPI000EA2A267|nr:MULTISPECIES: hypothetical protein [Bacillus]AYF06123.1 hypothetical protein MLA2C4_10650 [Bacillus mobilis]BCD29000.1 hypothetical protein BC30102_2036 [Bacillus cereus]HDX9571363.1 hypothetical protein [Bacillus mobilis]
MQPLKDGKYITYVAIAILLVVAIMSHYELPKKIGFITGVLILGACALVTNKFYERMYSKFQHK